MHDDFPALFDYSRWADGLLLDACRALSPEQYAAEPAPGWTPVRDTLAHMALVLDTWTRTLAGENVAAFPDPTALRTADDAAAVLEGAYERVAGLLPGLTPEALAAPREYRGLGRVVTVPPWVLLRHLVNHGTHHRGQVASKLARLGAKPPGTDLVFWAVARGLARLG
jgi:uncharacterized damage-inducible protein DinB